MDSKHTAEYKKCGIANNAEKKSCPADSKSCLVVDVWLKKIDDLPMSIYMCGPNKKSTYTCEKNGQECKPSCKKESIESYKQDLEEILKLKAKPIENLSDDCIKWLTDIHALTQSTCSNKDGCNECYCSTTKVSPDDEKCKTAPPPSKMNTTVATTIDSKPMTTLASNKTGNATTSGTAKLTNELMRITYLAFVFLISL